jgi:lysophospholipase L1-like esterase
MGQGKRLLPAISMLPVATAAFVAAQVLRAAHRSDLPSFPNQDPSGVFGDPAAPPVRIVALGDSSITAPGVKDLNNVWVRRMALDLARDHRVELISLAVGGSRVRDVIDGQLDAAVAMVPDLAIISVGANDAIRATPVGRFRRDLDRVLSRLETTAGAILVMGVGDLGTIPRLPRSLRLYLAQRSKVFDAISVGAAVARPSCVKVYTRGPISLAFSDHSLFAPDMFHAGDVGHTIFASEAMPAFRAALALAQQRRRAGLPAPPG